MATIKRSAAGIYFVGASGANFKDEDNGETSPTGFTITNSSGYVVRAKEDHTKILYLFGTNPQGETTYAFTDEDAGTIELYLYIETMPGAGEYINLYLYYNSVTQNIHLRIDTDGKIYALDGDGAGAPDGGYIEMATLTINTWHHFSIRWRGDSAAAYQGLANDEYKVFIDGTEHGDYHFLWDVDDNDTLVINTDASGTAKFFIDAIGRDWDGDYDIGDNLSITYTDPDVTISTVYSANASGKVMFPTVAEIIVPKEEADLMGKGCLISITDNYSIGGATASNEFFEGYIDEISDKEPYTLKVLSRAYDGMKGKPTGTESGRSDEIITAQIGDINYVGDGAHEGGTAMGTLTFGGNKEYLQCWYNLAKFEGSIFYFMMNAGVRLAVFNDMDTDTGVDITGASNIDILDVMHPAKRITKVHVVGLDGTVATATASAGDQSNYGINTHYHVDSLLSSALCSTCATNLLAALNNEIVVVKFRYQISGVGYIQPGQTITFSLDREGYSTIASQQFIVWQCDWDCVNSEGVLTICNYPYYESKLADLIMETSTQVQYNTDNMESYLAIGSANANYHLCSFVGADLFSESKSSTTFRNNGGGDFTMTFDVTLPYTLGSLSLYISELVIGIQDSDATHYLDQVQIYLWSDEDSNTNPVDLDHDTLNGTGIGTFTYDSNDDADFPLDISAQKRCLIFCSIVNGGTANRFDISWIRVKYYYA